MCVREREMKFVLRKDRRKSRREYSECRQKEESQ